MIRVERLDADNKHHFHHISPREQVGAPTVAVVDALAEQQYSWIAYDADWGAPVGAFGAVPFDSGYFRCWAFVDQRAPTRKLYDLLHYIGGLVEQGEYRRLEITVREDFPEGLAWPLRLGFKKEGVMRRFDIHGNDHYLLARVK